MLGQQRRVGASADWGRLRYTMDEGSAKAVRVAFERLYRDGLAYRTEALVNWCPGCRTSVSDLEVVADARDRDALVVRYHLIDEATGAAGPGRDDHRRHDPARDDPRRHRGRGPPRRRALPRARRAAGAHPVRRARRADHRRRRRRPRRSAPARSRSRPAHDHDDHETGMRHGLPAPTILADDATIAEHRHARTTGSTGTRRARRIVADLDGARRPRRRAGRTRWSSGAASAATTSSSRGSRPSGSSGPSRSPSAALDATRSRADADPARAVREDLGALADQHPRLERVAASCGGATASRPGTARTATSRCRPSADGPDGLRGLRPAGRRAPAGPGHLRHLVQLGAVAVLDARLAGRHARLRTLLPDLGHGDRLRHHLLLGRPDDDARARS